MITVECSVEAHTGSNGLCAMILLDLDNFKAVNDTLGTMQEMTVCGRQQMN